MLLGAKLYTGPMHIYRQLDPRGQNKIRIWYQTFRKDRYIELFCVNFVFGVYRVKYTNDDRITDQHHVKDINYKSPTHPQKKKFYLSLAKISAFLCLHATNVFGKPYRCWLMHELHICQILGSMLWVMDFKSIRLSLRLFYQNEK